MSITEVTMYRMVCDHPECDDSPQDHEEFYAYAHKESLRDIAADGDWWLDDDLHLCGEHRPCCIDCGAVLYGPDPTTCEDCDTEYDRVGHTYVKRVLSPRKVES